MVQVSFTYLLVISPGKPNIGHEFVAKLIMLASGVAYIGLVFTGKRRFAVESWAWGWASRSAG